MKKRWRSAVWLLLAVCTLCTAVSCGKGEDSLIYPTGETPLSPADVSGVYKANGASFAYLCLYEDGSYKTKDEKGIVVRSGSFISEGEYLVFDGYGVDDPNRSLVLRRDGKTGVLTSETDKVFTFSRLGGKEITENTDYSAWFGTYVSETGRISLGKGTSEGTALVVATPETGSAVSASVTFNSEVTAVCDRFSLTLDGSLLLVEGAEELSFITGAYLKESI